MFRVSYEKGKEVSKRVIEFTEFKLIVETKEQGKVSLTCQGGLDYDYDRTPQIKGERKPIQEDLELMFMPKKSVSDVDNGFELSFATDERRRKFENWLDKVKRNYDGIEDDKV